MLFRSTSGRAGIVAEDLARILLCASFARQFAQGAPPHRWRGAAKRLEAFGAMPGEGAIDFCDMAIDCMARGLPAGFGRFDGKVGQRAGNQGGDDQRRDPEGDVLFGEGTGTIHGRSGIGGNREGMLGENGGKGK